MVRKYIKIIISFHRTFADLAKGAPPYIDTELNKGSNDLDVPVGERITVFVPIETALRDYDLGNEEERELVGMAKFWSTISLSNLFCSNYACTYLEVVWLYVSQQMLACCYILFFCCSAAH